VLLSRHRLQRLRGARLRVSPRVSAALAASKITATVLVAEAAQAAALAALAAVTAAITPFAIATAEPAEASATAKSSAAAFPPAAFAAAFTATSVAPAVSAEGPTVSPWCGIRVHQHVQLQLLRLGEWLGQLLLATEQPCVRRRRAWFAVLLLLPRHRLQRLRRRRAFCLFASLTALAPALSPTASASALAPTTAAAAAATILVAEPAEAAPESTLAAETAAFATISFPTAAPVPLPTGYGCPVHQHMLRLLLLFVLRQLHVLRGPTG
jgi:hypothetical protein